MSGEAKNVRYHKSSEESASPGAAPAEPSESVPEAEASSRKPRNLFLRLDEIGSKVMVGMLGGRDVVRLDTAMVHRAGRVALLQAYSTIVITINGISPSLSLIHISHQHHSSEKKGKTFSHTPCVTERFHRGRLMRTVILLALLAVICGNVDVHDEGYI